MVIKKKKGAVIVFILLLFLLVPFSLAEEYTPGEIFTLGEGICQVELTFSIDGNEIFFNRADNGEDFPSSYATTTFGFWYVYPKSYLDGWELRYNVSTEKLILEKTANCEVNVCTDSDGGKNYGISGVATGGFSVDADQESGDECITSTLLKEFFCIDDLTLSSELYACPGQCENGRCLAVTQGEVSCEENWECASWGSCVNGKKQRSCVDRNSCGTILERPQIEDVCGAVMENATNEGVINDNKSDDDSTSCPSLSPPSDGFCSSGVIRTRVSDDGCAIGYTCESNLSNESAIVILPEVASQKAIEELGELDFEVELKEVGKNREFVYEAKAKKMGRLFGIFNVEAKVGAQINATTGEVISIDRPWWAFLAKGI